jgi:thiol-disulfide isomerase/thioredoxin
VLLPRYADRLKLTGDQRSRIVDLLKPPASEKEKPATTVVTDATQKRVQAVLTSVQQAELNRMIGSPVDVSRIRPRYCPAPEFTEISAWINSEPLDRSKLEGKVVVVHFWAFNCINCIRNLPHYQAWQEKYADKGVVIVGIHTPETEAERDLASVRAKVTANEMKYPVAVDGGSKTWNAWSNRWWPSVYLVDKRGYVRHWWYGELNWEGASGEAEMRKKIEQLLAERD